MPTLIYVRAKDIDIHFLAREDVRRWCSSMAGFPSNGSALYAAERAVQRPRRGSTAQAGFDQQASAMADAEVRTPEDLNGATGSQVLPSQCRTNKRSTLCTNERVLLVEGVS